MEKGPENFTMKEEMQDFFDNQITVISVGPEEFLKIMKKHNPDMLDKDVMQAKGWNFDDNKGRTTVLMRTDIFPEEYMPYLETHEKWEAYVVRKGGYNLYYKALDDYMVDRDIEEFDDKTKNEFWGELTVYNYEFRHEYAIYKEYQQAFEDGKLEEYHDYILDMRVGELSEAEPQTKEMIKNDTKIRQSIYDKITKGSKHYFTRLNS